MNVRAFSLAVCLALTLVVTTTPVRAAEFTASYATDSDDITPGDGICDYDISKLTKCGLRAAIQEANALAGTDTIHLNAGIYALTQTGTGEIHAADGDLDILTDLEIVGAGADATVVHGYTGERIFRVAPGYTVTFDGIAITGGDDFIGGGIESPISSTVTILACRISGNDATLGEGSATMERW